MSSDLESRRRAVDIEQAEPQPATGNREEEELAAAEKFLAATADAVHPDTPANALLHYTIGYRAHLAAMVAALRSPTSPQLPERS